MPDIDLPPEVRQLLAARIETYDQVEVLLLLHASGDRSWASGDVAANLRIPVSAADAALEHLCTTRLALAATGPAGQRFKYAPADESANQAVAELAKAHARNRVEIIQLLSSNAIERIRNEAIRLFADSFLLGRKKSDG
jgi:hypothetical protein